MKLDYSKLTEGGIYDILSKPYNPPKEPRGDEFRGEWYATKQNFESMIEELGTQHDYGEGDFYITDSIGTSRIIGLDITSKKLISAQLLPVIIEFIEKNDYRIAISFEYYGGNIPMLFIDRGETVGDIDKMIAKRLGLTVTSG